MSSFNSIRAQVVSLENQTSSLLSRYSNYAVSSSSSATADETKLDKQVESQLHKREELLSNLTRISDSDNSISTIKLQQLSRHREILQENWTNFANIRSAIIEERNKLNLLFNVKSDIQQRNNKLGGSEEDELNYIQDESRRANNMNNIADDLLNRAYETREMLLGQRETLNNAGGRILGSLNRVPGLNVLISKINTRRKRDALILASLITLCILFLFFTR